MQSQKWKTTRYFGCLFVSVVSVLFTNSSIFADTLNTQAEALKIIGDFADRICRDVPTNGDSSNIELSGTAKAELSTLLRKLANIGIEGTGKYMQGEYSGVLQKDLAPLLLSSIECRRDVANKLLEKFFPNDMQDDIKQPYNDQQTFNSPPSFSRITPTVLSPLEVALTNFDYKNDTWVKVTKNFNESDLQKGDIIFVINNRRVHTAEDVAYIYRQAVNNTPGATLIFKVIRKNGAIAEVPIRAGDK